MYRTDPNSMTVRQRIAAPTPKFFQKVKKISILLGAVGAALLSGGVAVPTLIPIGTILTTAGAVGTAVASTTVDQTALEAQQGIMP